MTVDPPTEVALERARDDASGPPPERPAAPLPWGLVLRLAGLRSVILGVALGLTLMALMLVIGCLVTVFGVGPAPSVGQALMATLGVGAICGAFCGVAFAPLALLEHAFARSDRWRVHAWGAAASFGVTLVVTVPLLCLQILYALLVFEQGPTAAAEQALVEAGRVIEFLRLEEALLVCALVVPVPFAIFARLRAWTHGRQVGWVVGATVLGAGLLCLGAVGAAHGGFRREGPLLITLFTGVATLLGALLPGVFARGDQLERWVVRRLWPDDA